ncbi:uncharacterized protein [Physcomitrium patens]|uniref:uncharacterized protein isoform X3 n=1 Tax=Physcomitrium patens TaxID=3218 RepID=UPI000D157310|nr:uncharacterized protein LOC112285013 isoform X3 [Physcomitrium patens]|eukprot:XP_024381224.1 uncharacterized protein LOC112285013 isoform X3 [Physcomitrella patens]
MSFAAFTKVVFTGHIADAISRQRCTALMNMPTRPQHAGSLWIRDAIFPGLCFLHTKPIGSLTHSIRKLRQWLPELWRYSGLPRCGSVQNGRMPHFD